jgi:hypothetical protein
LFASSNSPSSPSTLFLLVLYRLIFLLRPFAVLYSFALLSSLYTLPAALLSLTLLLGSIRRSLPRELDPGRQDDQGGPQGVARILRRCKPGPCEWRRDYKREEWGRAVGEARTRRVRLELRYYIDGLDLERCLDLEDTVTSRASNLLRSKSPETRPQSGRSVVW